MTNKQIEDIQTIIYFIPSCWKHLAISEEHKIMFLEYSEKGLHKDRVSERSADGFNALIQGKRWRGIHAHELFEPGVLDGSMPYDVILDNMPASVIRFMAKEMFKGNDSALILRYLPNN